VRRGEIAINRGNEVGGLLGDIGIQIQHKHARQGDEQCEPGVLIGKACGICVGTQKRGGGNADECPFPTDRHQQFTNITRLRSPPARQTAGTSCRTRAGRCRRRKATSTRPMSL
jgi:hypothetical protein